MSEQATYCTGNVRDYLQYESRTVQPVAHLLYCKSLGSRGRKEVKPQRHGSNERETRERYLTRVIDQCYSKRESRAAEALNTKVRILVIALCQGYTVTDSLSRVSRR